MEFIISRASQWNDKKPLKDKRVYSKVIPKYKNVDGEYSKETKRAWFIEINTLEELIDLYKLEGDLIIGKDMLNEDYTKLVIYDDYIE
jgi:hypothetical protein